ncbi:MAG: serpin family protein [Bacteroidales bacterium]|nr:serpin family protein [Bacteroidales bacterium]
MRSHYCTIGLCLLLVITSCNNSNNDWMPSENRLINPNACIELTRAEKKIAAKDLDFGIDMFKHLAKENGKDENFLFSPFSASLAYAMLSAGAEGKTRKEIVDALGFSGFEYADMASYYKKLTEGMIASDKKVELSFANAVWAGGNIKPDYVDEVHNNYNAEINEVDFSKTKESAVIINEWTSDKTHGLIPSIVNEQSLKGTVMMIENALYFKSQWSEGVYFAQKMSFTNSSGKTSQCSSFTNQEPKYYYSLFDDNVSVLKIPYSPSFNMMFVLPGKGVDINKFISTLDGQKWDKWSASCTSHKVCFEIPCFEDGSSMDLKSSLNDRGMKIPFTPRADFSKMTDFALFVTNSAQKTYIKVSENGTEAAAATTVGMGLTWAGPDNQQEYYFIADRPFLYAIEEASTGTLLFIGAHVK